MRLAVAATPRTGVSLGGMKLARLLSLPEREFAENVRKLEEDPLFHTLREAAVVSLVPYPGARFGERRYPGLELRASPDGFSDLLSEDGELLSLITRIGREMFEEHFLGEEAVSAENCARSTGLSLGEVVKLRAFVDRVYIQGEFSLPEQPAARERTYSPVAGIGLDGVIPVLEFFHREIWKGRYKIDAGRLSLLSSSLPRPEARRLEQFARELQFLDQRKTTFYRTLEAIIAAQTDYLVTGDSGRLKPLTQRAVAARIGAGPSVLNRIVSGKSVRLPSGLDIPIKALMPSAKSLLRERLRDVALASPGLSDESLRLEINRLCGATLSRRSITQYRNELGLGCRDARTF
jgi:hypothetical protein